MPFILSWDAYLTLVAAEWHKAPSLTFGKSGCEHRVTEVRERCKREQGPKCFLGPLPK